MDFVKYHSQVLKDIDHYVKRSRIGSVLKCEQNEVMVENKKVSVFNMTISLSKSDILKICGKNDEYVFEVLINGNKVYSTSKCNYRDEEFRNCVKQSEKYMNYINCFESIGKIFKKKRK